MAQETLQVLVKLESYAQPSNLVSQEGALTRLLGVPSIMVVDPCDGLDLAVRARGILAIFMAWTVHRYMMITAIASLRKSLVAHFYPVMMQ